MEKSVLPQKDFLKVSGKRFLFDFFKNQKYNFSFYFTFAHFPSNFG